MHKRINGKGVKAVRMPKERLIFMRRIKILRLLLGSLSGALLIAAAVVGVCIYSEGVTARQGAQELLAQYEQAASFFSSSTAAAEEYIPPEKPDVEPADAFKAGQTLSGYQVIGKLTIQKIGVELPVISHMDEKSLKVSVCYYEGAIPGEMGNMVISGHNYKNGAHFGKLDELEIGDPVIFETPDEIIWRYEVYDTQVVKPDNIEALEECEEQYELTLLTCTSQGNRRLLIRCRII